MIAVYDSADDNAAILQVFDMADWIVPPNGTAGLCSGQRLAWLLRATTEPDSMRVAAANAVAARHAAQELNNLAGETLAEWTGHADASANLRLSGRGRRIAIALLTLRAEHQRLLVRFGEAFADDLRLLHRLAVRTSARNQFAARIASEPKGTLREELDLDLAGGHRIRAAVTRASVRALQLRPGLEVVALIKAASVHLRAAHHGRPAASHNQLVGKVAHVQRDAEVAEVTVEIGPGLTGIALLDADIAARVRVGQKAILTFPSDSVVIGRVA